MGGHVFAATRDAAQRRQLVVRSLEPRDAIDEPHTSNLHRHVSAHPEMRRCEVGISFAVGKNPSQWKSMLGALNGKITLLAASCNHLVHHEHGKICYDGRWLKKGVGGGAHIREGVV